jgi:hypothetical protein
MVKQEKEPDTKLTQERLEFDHVMYNVLRHDKDSDLVKALIENGLVTMNQILSCPDEILYGLKILDTDAGGRLPKYKTILPGSVVFVLNLKRFNEYIYATEGDHPNWFYVTKEEFHQTWKTIVTTNLQQAPVSIPKATSPVKTDNLVALFHQQKRDQAVFPVLTDNKYWDKYYRLLQAVTAAHDMSDVLDPHYVPSTPEAEEVFALKNKWMYSTFYNTIKTDHGQEVLRRLQNTGPHVTQLAFSDIQAFAVKGAAATLQASELLTYLTTFQSNKVRWTGTAVT